jgi:nucleoid-associated protein YgaU
MQTLERDRTGRIAALQQENAAISARLRQAQGTLDQIASAARLMNPNVGGTVAPVRPLGGEPLPQPAATQARTHIVVDGDSLSRISLRYYGTPNRWQEIYDANRDSLAGANALRPGQPLRIP